MLGQHRLRRGQQHAAHPALLGGEVPQPEQGERRRGWRARYCRAPPSHEFARFHQPSPASLVRGFRGAAHARGKSSRAARRTAGATGFRATSAVAADRPRIPERSGREIGQEQDPVGEKHRLLDAVGDEHDGATGLSWMRRISSCRVSRVCTSTAANGSSISIRVGLAASTRARPSAAACRPRAGRDRRARTARPTSTAMRRATSRPLGDRAPGAGQAERDIVLHRHPVEQRIGLEHHAAIGPRAGDLLLLDEA